MSTLLLPEFRELIASRNFMALREAVEDWPIPDISEFMVDLEHEELLLFFLALPRDISAQVFELCELDIQEEFILGLAKDKLAEILNEMSPDDRTGLLEDLPAEVTRKLIAMLSPEERVVCYGMSLAPTGCCLV